MFGCRGVLGAPSPVLVSPHRAMSGGPSRDAEFDEEDIAEAVRRSLEELDLGGSAPTASSPPGEASPPGGVPAASSEPVPEPDGEPASSATGGSVHMHIHNVHIHNVVNTGPTGSADPAPSTCRPQPKAAASEPPAAAAAEPPRGTCHCSRNAAAESCGTGLGAESQHGYIVWANPADQSIRGIHYGGGRAWRYIEIRLPGGRYSYRTGVRLRKFLPEENPIPGYNSESVRHSAPQPPRIFRH